MDDEAIATVRVALGELNRALAALPALGIEAEFDAFEHHVISEKAACKRIALHLHRSKTEIDVRL